MIKRELYLKKLRTLYDSELIKVITGVRRCGKSVLLTQIIEELKERKINDENIIYINFEDYEYSDYTDPKKFHTYIKSQILNDEKYYLLFDEIQNVYEFEKVINSFRATLNVSIFITGSNNKLLSSELSTHLAGRYISIKMMPFTFKELIEFKKSKNEDIDIEYSFLEYMEWGGMPQIYKSNTLEEKKMYLKDLYNTVVLKDIVEINNVKDIKLLNTITSYMMEHIGEAISLKSILIYLKEQKIFTSKEIVDNYVTLISNSLIFDNVSRYDIDKKNIMPTLEKYYITDLGLLQLKKSYVESNDIGRLKNIIYNELITRGYDIYNGKTNDNEIDFIIDDFGNRKYIQVTDYLSCSKDIDSIFDIYSSVSDYYPKYVISMDRTDYSRNNIIHINIIDFLLGNVDI